MVEKLPNILAVLDPPPGEQRSGKIFIFSNGGLPDRVTAVALAEDGHCLGGAICQHEDEILSRTEAGRRFAFSTHYPDGYELVPAVAEDPRVLEAYAKNQVLAEIYRIGNDIEVVT